jgi:hypothetical protein
MQKGVMMIELVCPVCPRVSAPNPLIRLTLDSVDTLDRLLKNNQEHCLVLGVLAYANLSSLPKTQETLVGQ